MDKGIFEPAFIFGSLFPTFVVCMIRMIGTKVIIKCKIFKDGNWVIICTTLPL